MKRCTGCGLIKPFIEFGRQRVYKGKYEYFRPRCRQCHNQTNREWRLKNKDRLAFLTKRWREANPERMRQLVADWARSNKLRRAVNEQRRRNRRVGDFSFPEWIEILEQFENCCAYCFASCDTLTIDHVVPVSRGGLHDKENIVPACQTCNSSKGARSLDEFLWR